MYIYIYIYINLCITYIINFHILFLITIVQYRAVISILQAPHSMMILNCPQNAHKARPKNTYWGMILSCLG